MTSTGTNGLLSMGLSPVSWRLRIRISPQSETSEIEQRQLIKSPSGTIMFDRCVKYSSMPGHNGARDLGVIVAG
jgi:hypothetical protein